MRKSKDHAKSMVPAVTTRMIVLRQTIEVDESDNPATIKAKALELIAHQIEFGDITADHIDIERV